MSTNSSNSNYFLILIIAISSLFQQSCIRSFGSNYYQQQAYNGFGLKTPQARNSNIMPYIPGDKKAVEKIATQEKQNASTPSAQYSPYPLGNTSNYSQQNPSRPINTAHIANEYYSIYLKELGKYYGQYAEIFTAKNIPSDAQLMKSKSATALSGNDVMFETENSFDIPLDKKAIITSQRKIVENVKSRTEILKQTPQIVAQLQSSFDCMLIEAKNRIYSQKTVCGMAYFQSLGIIESKFGSMKEPLKQESSTQPQQPILPQVNVEQSPIKTEPNTTPTQTSPNTSNNTSMGAGAPLATVGGVVNNINITLGEDLKTKEKESHYARYHDEFEDKAVLKYNDHKSFAVYYDVGSFALDASAIYSVNKAIEFAQEHDDYKITVLGFTDRAASRDYNKVLSEKRAQAVVDALVKRGIAKEKLKKVFFGEDYNSVTTKDGVGEAFNRRVIIEVNVTGNFDDEEFINEKSLANDK